MQYGLLALFSLLMMILLIKFSFLKLLKLIRKEIWLRRNGEVCIGEIVSYDRDTVVDGIVYYTPIIEFKVASGEIINGKLGFGKPESELSKQRNLKIIYNKENVHEFISASKEPLFL